MGRAQLGSTTGLERNSGPLRDLEPPVRALLLDSSGTLWIATEHEVARLTGEQLQEMIRNGEYDFGVAFDGDADRVFVVETVSVMLQVASFNGKSQAFALLNSAFLVRRGRTKGGIEGDVISLVTGWPRADITSVFALGSG